MGFLSSTRLFLRLPQCLVCFLTTPLKLLLRRRLQRKSGVMACLCWQT
jgi:hypothetical protein